MLDVLLSWLQTPLSGASAHHIAPSISWHARFMVLAWGILLPVGTIVARFYKVTLAQNWPQELDNKRWWHTHRWSQISGVVLMSIGVVLALRGAAGLESASASLHRLLGWAVCAMGWGQLLLGLYRGSKGGPTDTQMRGDHYDMTPWRLVFERWHKGMGWVAVLCAVPTVALGLVAADAPRWMAVVLAAWWLALGLWFVRMQLAGRCMDTYQAIWGPDASHPGHRIPPVGWGVRRYTAASWKQNLGRPQSRH